MSEFERKQGRLQDLMTEKILGGILLRRVSSFAWATCGASSAINRAASNGEAMLLVTPENRYLLTRNNETARLKEEEGLAEQGWTFQVAPWHEVQNRVSQLAGSVRLGADAAYPGAADVSMELARLRSVLTPEEVDRFRDLAGRCAQAIKNAVEAVEPGLTEYEIAARLAYEAEALGVEAIVNLIATDDRILRYRHPLPTAKQLEKYAMLVLCGRRWGLVCSLTRLVHFGELPDELRKKSQAVAKIDARMISKTRPGEVLGDVFQAAVDAYAEAGFPDEWRLHHQGGPTGYEPREWVATPSSEEIVQAGQVYAWNPSITGAKSEDSILIADSGNEVLTAVTGWPQIEVVVDGRSFSRPAVLEV